MSGIKSGPGRRVRGFTLIEMMITIAIVAVLAAVALGIFTNYQRRARTVELQQFIGAVGAAQEEFRGYTGRYFESGANFCPAGNPGNQVRDWDANCIASWEPLAVALPDPTRFAYRTWRFLPGENCGVNVPGMNLTPCTQAGMDAGHRWVVVGIANQTNQAQPGAFYVTTSSLNGRLLVQNALE